MKRVLKITPKEDIDIGLAIGCANLQPGHTRTLREIAAFCGCRWQTIWYLEDSGIRKLRKRLYHDPILREIVEQIIGRPPR